MKARTREKRLRHVLETLKSWPKSEVEISWTESLLLYFQAYIVGNYIWNSNASLLNKLYVVGYFFVILSLIVYVYTLIPQSPEETS